MRKFLIIYTLAIFHLITSPALAAPSNEVTIANELSQSQSIKNMSDGVYAIPEKVLNNYFSSISQSNPKIKEASISILGNNKVMLTVNADSVGVLRLTCAIKEFHYDKDKATLELCIEKKEIVGHSVKSWLLNNMSLGLITSVYGNPLTGSKVNGNTIDIDLKPFTSSLFKNGVGQSIGDLLVISKITTDTGVMYMHTNCAISIIKRM
ncbi:MAG: hypothetical protein K0R55_1709 [Sporomusa sp.]|nr:hypothetical protein [Sporomusa sp.]